MRTVRAIGGLANRLRVVFSWRAAFGPIEVVWVPDGEIAEGRFGDVFEPVEGVRFVDTDTYGVTSTLDPYPHAPEGWERGYLELRPTGAVSGLLTALRTETPRYVAVHMRRTDNVGLAKATATYRDDETYEEWIRDMGGDACFVATDNGTTQRKMLRFLSLLGRDPIISSMIPERSNQDDGGHRNTNLEQAVVDLFMCRGATAFLGSGSSSFTSLVHTLRRLDGK